jgi:acetyltransferase-like isoleucine patch superfamily enzyme
VMLAPRVSIFAENHLFRYRNQTIRSQGVERLPVVIGDDCWLSSGVIVTGGTTIGKGSVVGAGSIVTHDLPDYSIAVGNPARVIAERE